MRVRESELGRTIRSAYQVQGEPDITMGEVVLLLRPGPEESFG